METAPGGGHADGACGLGGKRTGEVETWYLPARRLNPGRHRVRVRATSSECAEGGEQQRVSLTVTVR
jgi:hypothetical protein